MVTLTSSEPRDHISIDPVTKIMIKLCHSEIKKTPIIMTSIVDQFIL
jgi:hypothetical protein